MTQIGNISVARNSSIKIMGIINVSPESFYSGSVKITTRSISKSAINMEQEGADIIDIGGMSTAPYLENVIPVEKEMKRLERAIKIVRRNCKLPISADTPRSAVAREAVNLGVDCLNDITGLKYDENMASVVAESNLPVIVGAYGSNNIIKSQSKSTVTGRISGTVKLLKNSISIAKKMGIGSNKIIIDPSIGFFRAHGKNPFFTPMMDIPWYNRDIEIITRLHELEKSFSHPICISVSRKSFIGKLFDLKTEDRLVPSLVFEIIGALNGAKIIRTHNVKETFHALSMCELIY